jgi:hypothetical protein
VYDWLLPVRTAHYDQACAFFNAKKFFLACRMLALRAMRSLQLGEHRVVRFLLTKAMALMTLQSSNVGFRRWRAPLRILYCRFAGRIHQI